MCAAKPDARRGVPLRRFGEDLLLRNFRELANDLIAQMIVRQHPDALRRKHRAQSVDGLLDQRSLAEEAQDLLGSSYGGSAARSAYHGLRPGSGHSSSLWTQQSSLACGPRHGLFERIAVQQAETSAPSVSC